MQGRRVYERLKEGPLAAKDFAECAKSLNVLKVQVHNLRKQGAVIQALHEGGRRFAKGRVGALPVTYSLVSGLPDDADLAPLLAMEGGE